MTLLDKLRSRQARIGIVGLGYVGVPLAIRFAHAGCRVIGFDIDAARVAALNGGTSPFIHIPAAKIAGLVSEGFAATTLFHRIAEVDAIMICVPTPLTRQREPDMSFITATMREIAPHLRADQVLSLESTTYPGTTDEVIRPYIESRGFELGANFHLIYSPEREDPGNPRFSTQTIPKIVGGATPACLAVGQALYGIAVDTVVPVSSTQVAELTKLLENIHRSVNIGLVNEMKVIADRMGIDIFEVIDAAATKPFGFTPYYPGPGLGGHCIPVDPFYLTWKAREFGYTPHFIELAGEINRDMPQWVVGRVAQALNRQSKALNGSRILALGITYKRDIDDMRESPAVRVVELLREAGARLDYSDPNVPVFPPIARCAFDLRSVEPTPETLALYDCVVLLTDHSAFDYAAILEHSQLLVDTRGRFRTTTQNVVRG